MAAIQPCALLLLVGPDWRIETISANAGMLGDHRPGELVGQPFGDLIGSKAIHTLRNRLSWLSSDESEVQDFGVEWGGVTLDLRAIHEGDNYLIEAELAVEPRLPDGIGMVRSMSDRLTGRDPVDLAAQAMRQLHALTGFQQVVLRDRRGKIIATGQNHSADAPAGNSEITRLVADRDAEPVPLIGDEGSALIQRGAYLALSDGERETMGSLGIAASISLPLCIDGEQVASVHAYHDASRRCGAERRSVAHLFAERLAARMARQGFGF